MKTVKISDGSHEQMEKMSEATGIKMYRFLDLLILKAWNESGLEPKMNKVGVYPKNGKPKKARNGK